jgi:hypothetical protein
MTNYAESIEASLESIQWNVGDVVAPNGNSAARLTLLERVKGGWRVRQPNGRVARYSLTELYAYDKVRP